MQQLLLSLALATFLVNYVSAQPSASANNLPDTTRQIIAPDGPLSLESALRLAMSASPDIAAATHELEAVQGVVQQAGIIPNPSLEVTQEDTGRATRTTTVQINVPIELGGKRSARIGAAEREYDVAAVELNAKRAEVRATVIAAFYDLVLAQERYQLAQASSQLAKRVTNAASKRVRAGKVSPVEETRAQIAEASVRAELALVASQVPSARQRLAATWGSLNPRFEYAMATTDALPPLPALESLTTRLQQSPELMQAHIEVERRQALTRLERSRRIPDITVNIGAKRDQQLGRNQAIVGVSIPLPLFDRNQGNVRESIGRTYKARDELLATQLRLNSQLTQAYGQLHAARQEAQLLHQEILPGSQSAYDATVKGFDLGKFSFLEVLDAQRTYFQAKSQYLGALSQAHRAAADIDRIIGTPYTPINGATNEGNKK